MTRLALCAVIVALCGCSSPRGGGPYQTATEAERNPLRAQELTMKAAEIMGSDPAVAERLLRDALTADLYHGPAHNNLGVIHLERNELYAAASEFEWGRRLMPGHPDPRVNLALTLERAGRTDDAIDAYTSALEVYPDYMPAMQGLARLQLRSGRHDDRTSTLLREIALRGETERWREWAQRVARVYGSGPLPVHP